jgi:hypothetical protein
MQQLLQNGLRYGPRFQVTGCHHTETTREKSVSIILSKSLKIYPEEPP